MAEANLLVTFDPAHAGKAEEEVRALLRDVGEEADFQSSECEGVFLLRTKGDPKGIVRTLRAAGKENPGQFGLTYHWVPIEKWVSSDMASMQKAMSEIDRKMDPAKKWKLHLAKRRYDEAHTTDLIMKLTEKIEKPNVDLKNPDVIVVVEIVGKKAGVALVGAHEILDVPKLKMGSKEVH